MLFEVQLDLQGKPVSVPASSVYFGEHFEIGGGGRVVLTGKGRGLKRQ